MSRCGERTLIREEAGYGEAVTQRCKRWACELCRPIEQSRLARHLMAGSFTDVVTFTVNPKRLGSPHQRARELARQMPRVFNRAKRKFGAKIPYSPVFEAHESGEPHLHAAVRLPGHVKKWVFELWLRKLMAELIGAPNVDVTTVDDRKGGVAGFASYLAKAPVKFVGCKRFWATHDWTVIARVMRPVFDFTRGGFRQLIRASSEAAEHMLAARGCAPHRLSPSCVAYAPP